MKTIGIIAEYNPFHNGHAYQIKKIKELTHADFVIVAMSGDFVQRGAPAILDKYARTQMALSCGADLVLELPVLWATSSAEYFAMAGVTLFDKMNCVDALCFGAETDNLTLLSQVAEVLATEPENYRDALSSYLKEGMTFPQARAKALSLIIPETSISADDLGFVLNTPNNILAIEYLKALRRRNSKIAPFVLKREGTGYHDTSILTPHANMDSITICASATAIRKALLQEDEYLIQSQLKVSMPEEAFSILDKYRRQYPFLNTDDFSTPLAYRILMESETGLANFLDANDDISNRILNHRHQFLSFSQFCEQNKSRDITYTRMSRILLHILLGLTDATATLGKRLDYIHYFRILGFRRSSAAMLTRIKTDSSIPIISKLADAKNILSPEAFQLLKTDIYAAELYEQILSHKKKTTPRNEYTRGIVLL